MERDCARTEQCHWARKGMPSGRVMPHTANTHEEASYTPWAACQSLCDDHVPKGGPVDARIVFRSHDAFWLEAGFLIHHSPQAYYRPDLLGPTSIFLSLPINSWSLIQKPRTMPRHSGIYTIVMCLLLS